MRVLNILFIILFVVSAALQYNDPDPYLWIPLYLYGALISFYALRRKMLPVLYIIGLVIYSSFAIYLFFGEDGVLDWWHEHKAENIAQSMKATKPWIEATREFFGLVLLIVALLANWIWLKRAMTNRNTSKTNPNTDMHAIERQGLRR